MSIDFSIRDFAYPFAILGLRRFFERSQWLPQEELRAYQDQKLRETIAHSYRQVPYYNALFRRHRLTPNDIRTVRDLDKIPPLSKETLRREFVRLRAADAQRFHPRECQTSGTGGEPLHFLLDKPANVLEFVYYWRHWSWVGYRLGTCFAELNSSYFMKSEERSRRLTKYQLLVNRVLLNSLSLNVESVPRYAEALRRHRPLFLKGIASALYYFALIFKRAGINDISFRAIFSTGEMLMPWQRRTIEQVFHCQVLDSYGHMERTVAVSECPHGGLHIHVDYGILELVDRVAVSAQDSVSPRYRAQVRGTSLHTRSMPLLRYETGDVIEFEEPATPCPCGRTLPRVCRILGRREDIVQTPEGGIITTLFIVFNDIPEIALGQIVQDDNAHLTINVVRGPGFDTASENVLLQRLRHFVGPTMRITIHYQTHDEFLRRNPGKFRAVVSHLSRSDEAAVNVFDA